MENCKPQCCYIHAIRPYYSAGKFAVLRLLCAITLASPAQVIMAIRQRINSHQRLLKQHQKEPFHCTLTTHVPWAAPSLAS